MPAQIPITRAQAQAIAALDEDLVLVENHPGAQALDVWVLDEESKASDTHRHVVIDESGGTIMDNVRSDFDDT